jgi:hypothetical protein
VFRDLYNFRPDLFRYDDPVTGESSLMLVQTGDGFSHNGASFTVVGIKDDTQSVARCLGLGIFFGPDTHLNQEKTHRSICDFINHIRKEGLTLEDGTKVPVIVPTCGDLKYLNGLHGKG